MIAFVLQRLIQSIAIVIAMSIIVFVGVTVVGNPVDMLISPEVSQADRERIIRSFGLDLPIHQQYFVFALSVLRGEFGQSFVFGESAIKLIVQRMPATLELATTALLISIIIGLPLGVRAGLKPDSIASRLTMSFSILGFSLPTFWIGIMLMMLFAVVLGWLPATGRGPTVLFLGVEVSFLTWDGLRHLILPATTLALLKVSLVIRLARAGTLEVVHQDYIRTARAKGLKNDRIVFVHVLKNIMIPIVTIIGLEFGQLIAFSIVTETIFSWPGMGKLIVDSIRMLDRPIIVAYLMIIVVLITGINFIVDIIYAILDPRIRHEATK
ncbi:MAG: ABC transporter permease [Salinarimonadaceae bacterium]|nr:MAG: ABC transporter permease [Salinarimonadaceae bacterium]